MCVESVRAHFLDHVPRKDLPAIGDAFARLYAAQHADVAEFETVAPDCPVFLMTTP
jgi:hypothetical protein